MKKDEVARSWQGRGFSCDMWIDSPGQLWEDYVHGVDELFMVIEGEVELEMNGKRVRPKPGEEVLIPANVRHTVRNAGRTASRWFYGYQQQKRGPA